MRVKWVPNGCSDLLFVSQIRAAVGLILGSIIEEGTPNAVAA